MTAGPGIFMGGIVLIDEPVGIGVTTFSGSGEMLMTITAHGGGDVGQVIVGLTANQAVQLIQRLQKYEDVYTRAIAQGRGGALLEGTPRHCSATPDCGHLGLDVSGQNLFCGKCGFNVALHLRRADREARVTLLERLAELWAQGVLVLPTDHDRRGMYEICKPSEAHHAQRSDQGHPPPRAPGAPAGL
jgi:hypothetical protein